MGMTVTEKIIAAHCGRDEVSAGEFVYADVDILLEKGCSPLWVPSGKKYLELNRLVMVRSTWGAKDFMHIQVADYTRMCVVARLREKLRRASIVDDGARLPDVEWVTTPSAVAGLIYDVLVELEEGAFITGVADLWEKHKKELLEGEFRLATPTEMVAQFHRWLIRLDVIV